LAFLPAVMFLIVFPQVAHGRTIGLLVLPACALAGSFGLWKLGKRPVVTVWTGRQ
jgi:hypothetical protein